ncbi:acetate--CoA ligase ACS2 [Ascoidea rubescens DSM 1968]|uniref:Acetyl-coenzyme A synthetase n=1 Tax=Ascoidea rubescens DSM 1968 TaxID=1344418 RepID=A0A1D2VKY4_9ASCO|nr:acetate--CoA ligase [Ascoidea rubescens DSM 1968]ODV62248.1 acetate--CoA ligase [Ascoidea rubescens DSM 1968]
MTLQHQVVHEANNLVARSTPKEFFQNQPEESFCKDLAQYKELHKQSIENPEKFFGDFANQLLDWDKPFVKAKNGHLRSGDASWFLGGKLNASFNCVDRHAFNTPDKVAIIYEADEETESPVKLTYADLLSEVSKVAAILSDWGVKKGDRVAIYLPMIPAAIIAILAVVRLGAVHSIVFAGFSAASLRDRIVDCDAKVIITSDEGKRASKVIHSKKIVDTAIDGLSVVEKVLVFQRTAASNIPMKFGRDFWWHEEAKKFSGYFPPTSVDSEDPLFLLYTSGSTGSPKGVVHSTAGYLLGAALTTRYVFDIHQQDILFTAGDVGWITGHTYACYGPLLLGCATIIFESTPTYPDIGRYWRIVQRHKATHFYVAPTALRLIKQLGESAIAKYDISSLRTLGSVGEPIAPELWQWYDEKIGQGRCHIADTYWQTESGCHLIAPLAGAVPTKPGSATVPFFGIDAAIIDPVSGKELKGNDVAGVLAIKNSWPSMARSVFRNHDRYIDTYLKPYPGYYFTGDGAGRDNDGYYWIRGRVDDVVNVSGHRLSTAEIEAALLEHSGVSEAAVVGIHDDLTGQAVVAFVGLKEGYLVSRIKESESKGDHITLTQLRQELRIKIRAEIGPFAAPKTVIVVPDLPKTRSGKIMRRILRKIISNEADQIGDTSTLSNPSAVEKIITSVDEQFFNFKK